MQPNRPLALSVGDPAGIGPELLCAAWRRRQAADLPPFFAVHGGMLLRAAGKGTPITLIDDPADAAGAFDRALPVLRGPDIEWQPGRPNDAGARFALASLRLAASLAMAGDAAGIVTGPIAKHRLAAIGFDHPGQTEFVAAACGVAAEDAVMMLAGPSVRTVPLTVHIPLAAVAERISTELIIRRTRIVAAALTRDFGIAVPQIALAALDPHAGENGRIGTLDDTVVVPAIATLRAEGIAAAGPIPADSLFAPRERSRFDAMVCMYHDQALIPVKALDFDEGVNVTLGLPIVRTSPDHGTAFAIAGTQAADAGATIAAIRMAGAHAARRQAERDDDG